MTGSSTDLQLTCQPTAQVVSTEVTSLVAKRILREGRGLETPHPPYEVRL